MIFCHSCEKWDKPMRSKYLIAFTLVLTSFVLGCQAKGPLFEPLARNNPDNALVYVYWPAQTWREKSGSYPELLLDGEPIGLLRYKTYMALEISPGTHDFLLTGDTERANWQTPKNLLTLPLKPNETKYLRLLVKYDQSKNNWTNPGMSYVVQFLPIAGKQARTDLADLHLALN